MISRLNQKLGSLTDPCVTFSVTFRGFVIEEDKDRCPLLRAISSQSSSIQAYPFAIRGKHSCKAKFHIFSPVRAAPAYERLDSIGPGST